MTVTQRFPLAPGESEDLSQLAVELLQDLIRIDTSNPPGNEVAAAEYLAGRFRAEGLSPTVLEPSPGRGNVIVRLPAPGTAYAVGGGGSAAVCDGQEHGLKAGLLLLSHLDVVPAEAGGVLAQGTLRDDREGIRRVDGDIAQPGSLDHREKHDRLDRHGFAKIIGHDAARVAIQHHHANCVVFHALTPRARTFPVDVGHLLV